MGGFYAILAIEREEIREKIEQKIIKSLKKSDLICIVANDENLPKIIWERPEKEFHFEGSLYDVAYVETVLGVDYYYCLSDKDETILEAKIDKLLENQTDKFPLRNQSKRMLHFLSEPLLKYNKPVFQFNYFINKNTPIFTQLTFFYLSNLVSKLKQPPQFS